MYKLEIKIDDWSLEDEVVTIESPDFEKLSIIAEFIEFQKDYGWAVDYEPVDYDDEEDELDSEEEEDSEESEIGELVEDEEGSLWERVA